nr:MAG TPA: hypothetical protein [Caudoviricetes sp.]
MPVPLFKLSHRGSLQPLRYTGRGYTPLYVIVLSDRHKKSATRIEGGLSPPYVICLNTAILRKVFERANCLPDFLLRHRRCGSNFLIHNA